MNFAKSTNNFCQLTVIDIWCNKAFKRKRIYVSYNIYIYINFIYNIDFDYFVVDIKRAHVQQLDLFLFLRC